MNFETSKLNRMNVIGSSGSVKSTYSKELARTLNLQ